MSALLAGCGNADRLSDEIVGTWEATPEPLNIVGAQSATLTRIMEFTGRDDSPEGSALLTGIITVVNTTEADNADKPNDSAMTPVQISATGTFSVAGAFQAMNGHEIDLRLDRSSLSVAVDPRAVEIKLDLSAPSAPKEALEHLRPNAAALIRQQITRAANRLLFDLDEIDEIAIADSTLTCEVKGSYLTFRRKR